MGIIPSSQKKKKEIKKRVLSWNSEIIINFILQVLLFNYTIKKLIFKK